LIDLIYSSVVVVSSEGCWYKTLFQKTCKWS